jgi:hypothetical protein
MKFLIFPAFFITILTGFHFTPRPTVFIGENVALAELFTSEGCSSCPVADEMLQEMTDILKKENKPVLGLAFHITYWDHLGWKDSFSQQKFTDRQKKYCTLLQVPSIYTPQMIINGEYEFVGSNPIAFRETVEKVLTHASPYQFDAHATLQGNVVSISYSLNKKTKHELLNIALIELSVKKDVKRGENKNRILKHYNVVRELQTMELLPSGESKITLPADLDPNNSAVVIFVQHQRNLKVLGAVKIPLTQQ